MLKTLGAKHKSTVTKMATRHKAKTITPDGPRTCFEARLQREGKKDLVARFGGIALKRDRRAVIHDPAPVPVITPRKELIHRLRCTVVRSFASTAPRWQSTTSPHSPNSADQDRASPRGRPSWPGNGARLSSSALPATSTSTPTRSRARHKSPESLVHRKVPAGFGGRLRGKGPPTPGGNGTSPRSPSCHHRAPPPTTFNTPRHQPDTGKGTEHRPAPPVPPPGGLKTPGKVARWPAGAARARCRRRGRGRLRGCRRGSPSGRGTARTSTARRKRHDPPAPAHPRAIPGPVRSS